MSQKNKLYLALLFSIALLNGMAGMPIPSPSNPGVSCSKVQITNSIIGLDDGINITVCQHTKGTELRFHCTCARDADRCKVSGEEEHDEGGSGADGEVDDDGRVYKNPRNSPSAMCPRDEEQATLLGQKCLRKCSSDEDCKSKKKKCLCDGACGMSCIKPDRECPDLEQPKIGAIAVTGKLFGDKASYSCPHGYHVVGLQSRNCQADGEWAGQAPACKKNIYCLSPPTIEHARHSALPEQATFDLDATVTYSCLTGYVTNGFSRAKCLAIDGQASWYGPDISCEARSCGPPGDVPHGWVTAECHTFTCRALLQCGAGFELVGKADRYCQADGNWAPKELPTCVLVTAVQCAAPEGPRHGKAVYTSCAYNSVVSYECKYGYRLVGDATRRCGADKKWSGSQPVCKEINCGHPGQLYNGWLENISAGTGLGASIIFRCHDGMKMEGNSSTICQIDGTWRYPLPKCLAPCVVPHVTQGKVILVESNEVTSNESSTSRPVAQEVSSSTMVHHGEELIVDCESNYEFPSNNPAVTCNNGTWTQIPRCQPARCKRMPKFPRNGMVLAAKTDHGMKARFRCKDGFELHGPPTVVCAFGNWTGLTPQCQEVYCPFPGFLENGKVLLVGNMGLYDYRPYVRKVVNNKQIMYDCDKGYVLSEGAPGATCIGGQWRPRELPKCTLGQHPRIRWSRRRRSVTSPLLQASHLHHITVPSLHRDSPGIQGLYHKYNPESRTPTLRHANYKILKRLDKDEEESEVDEFDEDAREHVPTALYTVYNIHGEPIGHRLLYTYQPVYETDEDDAFEETEEEEPEITGDEDNFHHFGYTEQGNDNGESMIVLRGGMFADRSDASRSPEENRFSSINSLKKRYFQRYFDKRKKRFSNGLAVNGGTDKETHDQDITKTNEYVPTGTDHESEYDIDPDFAESKRRTKRDILSLHASPTYHRLGEAAKFDTSVSHRQIRSIKPIRSYSHDNIMHISRQKSFPNEEQLSKMKTSADFFRIFFLMAGKHVRKRELEAEDLTVIPLPKSRRFSSKTRDKRTSRKTDKLNQTTATVPKTGRDHKGGKSQLGLIPPLPDAPPSPSPDSSASPDTSPPPTSDATRRPRLRPAVSCEPISSEPYVNIEVVKLGRDPNVSFSSGTIVRVACGKGYGLNLDTNTTAKCVRGRWKPMKPLCEILPCHIPASEYGIYTLGSVAGILADDARELNETDDVGNGQVVQFSCQYGYNVQGPSNLRCWHGDWAVTSWPECVPSAYEAGYRTGLAVGHDASVAVLCPPQHAPPAVLHCRLGRLQASPQDYCVPVPGANITIFKSKSEYQSGSDIVREDITELEPLAPGVTSSDCGPPTRVQGSLVYRSGWTDNTTTNGGRVVVGGYPHGTQVTFKCIASIMGEKTTWKIICEQGNWIGKSFNCEELEAAQSESLLNNSSCIFHNDDPNVVSFYQDMQVKEDTVEFSTGAVLVSRCVDIGKYAMTGSSKRRCLGRQWDGEKPTCLGLNQENDYAMEKSPTILIRYEGGPIAQSNDGRLLVYPGTILHMECLWMKRFGNPKWQVSHENRKYPEGWSTDPGRDSTLEYRITIDHATKDDSGVFTCMTPAKHTHAVEVVVEEVHCPVLAIRRGLIASSQDTKMSSEVSFSCANGNALLGAHTLVCLPSGNWSAPLPVCESVECGEVSISSSTSATTAERVTRPRVSVVSRGVGGRAAFSCSRGWGLRGVAETECLPNGQWARPFPTCVEVWCPPPTAPANGYVLGNAPHRAGDVLQFHCNAEHALRGRPIVVCQDSGRWSDAPPSCEQACTYPGTTISGRMSSVKFYYRIGETITFSCEPGYKMKGAPMLRCLRNRKWSNAIPICTNSGSNFNDTTASSSAVLSARDELAMLSDESASLDRPRLADDMIFNSIIEKRKPATLSDESASLGRSRLAADRTLKAIVRVRSMQARVVRANRLLYEGGDRPRDEIGR